MFLEQLKNSLEICPIISAVSEEMFSKALVSPTEVIFYLEANLLTIEQRIKEAHANKKFIFVHLDLADGIGKDRTGLVYLSKLGVDGIITTKAQLIRSAKELKLLTVQRFFTLDTKGLNSAQDVMANAKSDMIEIMPGIATKVIKRFATGNIPIIAGGLIETKSEVTEALSNGAFAVSTGKEELWYL